MKVNMMRASRLFVALNSLVLATSLMAAPVARNQSNQPDNTRNNKDQAPPTADKQPMNSSDAAITQKIRKAIHDDASLSINAHNIKVITQGGKVTLRGPVKSEDEKSNLEAKAVSVAGQQNVDDQLTVANSQ
jgi:osmotically-inducible protein OsmY